MNVKTEAIDAMALSLRDTLQYCSTEVIEAAKSMVALLVMEARATILGGVAVDPCLAVGLYKPDQIKPSQIFNDGEAAFVGNFAGIELVDFTAAIAGDRMLKNTLRTGEELVTHGLVFRTKPELEDLFEGNLGVASLLPYVAVLPGSLYQITRLTL